MNNSQKNKSEREMKLQDIIDTIQDNLILEWFQIIPCTAFNEVSELHQKQNFKESFMPLVEMCLKAYFDSLIEHGKVIPNWGESIDLVSLSWIWGTSEDDSKLMLAATNLIVSSSDLFDSNIHYAVDGKRFEIYKLHGTLYAEEI